MYETKLKELAKSLGADLVGFCELPTSPLSELPSHKYAVSIGVKLGEIIGAVSSSCENSILIKTS